MIETLGTDVIDSNYLLFKNLLLDTQRSNIQEFLQWLDTTDFKTAPASSKFHLNVLGGLCKHSLNVYYAAQQLNEKYSLELNKNSIALSCLLHDLCKVHMYKKDQVWDKEWKNKTNEWRKTEEWIVDEDQPFGHGEKSAILAGRFSILTEEEIAAIRWHLGFADPATHFFFPSGAPFKKCMDKYPLVQIVVLADSTAQYLETFNKEISYE